MQSRLQARQTNIYLRYVAYSDNKALRQSTVLYKTRNSIFKRYYSAYCEIHCPTQKKSRRMCCRLKLRQKHTFLHTNQNCTQLPQQCTGIYFVTKFESQVPLPFDITKLSTDYFYIPHSIQTKQTIAVVNATFIPVHSDTILKGW